MSMCKQMPRPRRNASEGAQRTPSRAEVRRAEAAGTHCKARAKDGPGDQKAANFCVTLTCNVVWAKPNQPINYIGKAIQLQGHHLAAFAAALRVLQVVGQRLMHRGPSRHIAQGAIGIAVVRAPCQRLRAPRAYTAIKSNIRHNFDRLGLQCTSNEQCSEEAWHEHICTGCKAAIATSHDVELTHFRRTSLCCLPRVFHKPATWRSPARGLVIRNTENQKLTGAA